MKKKNKQNNKSIKGSVTVDGNTLEYTAEPSAIKDLMEIYGIDAISEIEGALKQELKKDAKNAKNLKVKVPKIKKPKRKAKC